MLASDRRCSKASAEIKDLLARCRKPAWCRRHCHALPWTEPLWMQFKDSACYRWALDRYGLQGWVTTHVRVCVRVCVCLRLNDQWLIIDWFLFISFGIVSKHFREALGFAASTCSCLHCCAGSELASALWRSRRAEGGLPHSDIQWPSNSSPMS